MQQLAITHAYALASITKCCSRGAPRKMENDIVFVICHLGWSKFLRPHRLPLPKTPPPQKAAVHDSVGNESKSLVVSLGLTLTDGSAGAWKGENMALLKSIQLFD